MGWTFTSTGHSSPDHEVRAALPSECVVHLTTDGLSERLGVVRNEIKRGKAVGKITITSGGAKLEAVNHPLSIQPGQVHSGHSSARYELQPGDSVRNEIFLLRHGDIIHAPETANGLLCSWDASEVQVGSSAAPAPAVANVEDNDQGITETPEEETSDEDEDEDLDKTMDQVFTTQTKPSQQLRATPKLSAQPSVVVEETPTTARVNGFTEYSNATEQDIHESGSMTDALPLDEPDQVNVEQYSTARTGESQHASETPVVAVTDLILEDIPESETKKRSQTKMSKPPSSPKIIIPVKRSSPALLHDDSEFDEVVQRPLKRRRGTAAVAKDNGILDGQPNNVATDGKADATPTRKRGRARASDSQRGADTPQSQLSTTSGRAGSYDGPKPCVALSNSALNGSSQAVRFLKKNGGSLIESVKGNYNILCIRDGSLHKTAKVLRAIATGAAIVTDKWLIDSAVAENFLSVQDYQPNVSNQESEWNFSLKDISGIAQRPFVDRTLHFTSKVQSSYSAFSEIEQVCLAAGATRVTKRKPSKDSVVLAADDGDEEADKLVKDGTTCYTRDLIPISIFRGKLELDSEEFQLKPVADKPKKKGRKS